MPVWNMDASGNKIEGYKVEGGGGQSFNIPTDKQLTRYQLEDEIAKKIQGIRRPSMQRKAVTCQDFPEVCKNCKSLCVPAGYKELSFLDHRDKPVCTVTNPLQKVGFRYAYMRECRGYDPIVEEMTQQVKTPGESIFKKLTDKGEQPIMKKVSAYEKTPKNEPATPEPEKEAMERGKKICPKCVSMGYFVPRGQHNQVHDWHSLWNCDFNSVAHNPKGICVPHSLAGQSQPEGGPNQFDSAGNRVVNVNK
jgi:hypothetical protein